MRVWACLTCLKPGMSESFEQIMFQFNTPLKCPPIGSPQPFCRTFDGCIRRTTKVANTEKRWNSGGRLCAQQDLKFTNGLNKKKTQNSRSGRSNHYRLHLTTLHCTSLKYPLQLRNFYLSAELFNPCCIVVVYQPPQKCQSSQICKHVGFLQRKSWVK